MRLIEGRPGYLWCAMGGLTRLTVDPPTLSNTFADWVSGERVWRQTTVVIWGAAYVCRSRDRGNDFTGRSVSAGCFIRTDKGGVFRQTNFSGWNAGPPEWGVGADVDYPVWLGPNAPFWTRTTRPVVRLGIQYDHYGAFIVSHDDVATIYDLRIQPKDSVTVKAGLGMHLYAP